jgi:hypothetical protein
MKSVFVASVVALAVSHAQAPSARITAPPPAVHITQSTLWNLEKTFDGRLDAMDTKDPLDTVGWGGTRGVYLEGFGMVFTTDLSLIRTPSINPFRATIPDDLKVQVHQRKLNHVPQLEDLMKELVTISARTLAPLPDDQKIVYVVRMRYLPYEQTYGLPAQIMMTADKKAALMGDIKTKVE